MTNLLANARRPAVVVAMVLIAAGCAARRPVLYPNQHLEQVGGGVVERDILECRQLADAHTSGSRTGDAARSTAIGGGTGAAAGAVGGAIYGDAGRGAAAGAAAGAATGLLHSLLTGGGSTDLYRNFVAACLSDRGYRVIGWE